MATRPPEPSPHPHRAFPHPWRNYGRGGRRLPDVPIFICPKCQHVTTDPLDRQDLFCPLCGEKLGA